METRNELLGKTKDVVEVLGGIVPEGKVSVSRPLIILSYLYSSRCTQRGSNAVSELPGHKLFDFLVCRPLSCAVIC